MTIRRINTNSPWTFPEICRGNISELFYEMSITPIPESDKHIISKENCRPSSLVYRKISKISHQGSSYPIVITLEFPSWCFCLSPPHSYLIYITLVDQFSSNTHRSCNCFIETSPIAPYFILNRFKILELL